MSEHLSNDVIRACADGDLDAARAAEVEQQAATDHTLRARLAFERAVRDRVGAVMGESAAPLGLEARLRAALADAPDDPAGRIDPDAAPEVRRSWLTGPARANVFAVAATLALVAGAVLFGIFGPPIDTLRTPSLISQTADFVSGEHMRCAGEKGRVQRKAMWTTLGDARAGLPMLLGVPVQVPDLTPEGFLFVGAGACGLPGGRASGHALYVLDQPAEDGCNRVLLSLFVVPDAGQYEGLEEIGRIPWAWEQVADQPECDKNVACCSDGVAVYFLVSCNDGQLEGLEDLITRSVPDR